MSNRTAHAPAMALDFNGWMESLPAPQRDALTQRFSMSADPEREKRRLTNTFFLAERNNLPLRQVDSNYEAIRSSHGTREGWGDAWKDDVTFHGRIVDLIAKERDEATMLAGVQGDDEKSRKTRSGSLASVAYQAGSEDPSITNDGDMVQAFSKWQASASKSPAYRAERAADYYSTFAKLYAQGANEVGEARKAAEAIFPILAKHDDWSGPGLDEAMPHLANLKGDWKRQFDLTLREVRRIADKRPDEKDGAAVDAAKAFNRGALRFTQSLGGFINSLDSDDAASDADARKGRERHALRSHIANRLSQTADSAVSPIISESWYGEAIKGAAESLPRMGALMLPVAGQVANFAAYVHDAEVSLLENGVPVDQSRGIAPFIAGAQSALDRVQLGLLKKMPGLDRVLKKYATTAIARGVGRVAATTAAEVGIELTQDQFVPAAIQDVLGALDADVPGVKWAEVMKETWANTPGTFLSMLPLALLGAGAAHARDVKASDRLARSPDALQALGFTPSHIAAIQLAPEGDAVRTMRAVWGERVPVLKGDRASLAAGDAAQLAAKSLSGDGTGAPGEPVTGAGIDSDGGPRPHATPVPGESLVADAPAISISEPELNQEAGIREIRRGDDGWYLVTEDGTRIQTGTAEAALHMRESLRRASTQAEADALVSIADDIAGMDAAEGKGSSQTFSSSTIQARADGTVRKDDKVITFDGSTMDNLRAEMQAAGLKEAVIRGSNEALADDTGRMVRHYQTNQGGDVTTILHERFERLYREGRVSDLDVFQAANTLAALPAFDPAKIKDPGQKAVAEKLRAIALDDPGVSDASRRETIVELAVSDAIGRTRDGTPFKAGTIETAIREAATAAATPKQRAALGNFRGLLRMVKSYLKAMFGLASRIAQARRKGDLKKGDAWTELVDKLLNLTEQKRHNEAVAEGAGAVARNDRTTEDDGATFSLASIDALETIAQKLDRLKTDPKERLAAFQKDADDLRGMQRSWEHNDSLANQTTVAGIERQRAQMRRQREAELFDQIDADFGDLSGVEFVAAAMNSPLMDAIFTKKQGDTFPRSMIQSRAKAERRGRDSGGSYDGAGDLPSWIFGGSVEPDVMAQDLYEQGLLKEPTPDALWNAISQALKSAGAAKERLSEYAQARAEARTQAREEARAWADERLGELPGEKRDAERKEVNRALVTLDVMLAKLPAEIRGMIGGFVKLASLTTDRARLKFLLNRLDKMDRVLEKFLQGEYRERLDKLIEQGQPNAKPGEKSKGKIGPAAHRFFAEVLTASKLDKKGVEARQKALEDDLTREREEGEEPLTDSEAADIFEKQQITDTFGNLDGKSAQELAAAHKLAEAVYETGRNKWRIQEEMRLAGVAKIAETFTDALGKGTYGRTQDKKNVAKRAGEKVKAAVLELQNLAGFLRSVLGDGHPVAKKWSDAARAGITLTEDARRELRKEWDAVIQKATGKKGREARLAVWDMANKQSLSVTLAGESKARTETVPVSVLEDIMDGKVKPADVGLTQKEADKLIAQKPGQPLEVRRESRGAAEEITMTEAEGIFVTMLAKQEQYAAALDSAGFTDDAMDSIEKALSPAAKQLREFMREKYRDGYAPLNGIFERMFGVSLPQIDNYAPAAFYHTGDEKVKGPDETVPEGGFRAGFLKNRKRHSAAPKLENAFATFFGHQAQMNHWQGFAELVREMRGVIGRPDVKRAVEAAHGKEVLGLLNDWVKALEGNGIQKAHGVWDSLTGWLLRQAAYVHLAFKVGTLAVQSTAALGSAYRISAGAYMRGLGRLVKGNLELKRMWNSPLIQNRLTNGFAPEVRAALNDLWGAKPSRRQDFLEKGMDLIGWTDAVFTTASAAIAYDHFYNAALKTGLSESQAHASAEAETAEVVSETAQPSTVPNRSLFELKQGNLGKLAFMYASDSRQKTALWAKAWGNTLTGKATAQDVQVLVIAHLIVGPLIQTIRNAIWDMQDDDDGEEDEVFDEKHWKNGGDWLKAVAMGPLSGIPLLNDITSGFKSNNAAVGRFADAKDAIGEIVKGPAEKNPEKAEYYWKRMVKVLKGMDAATATGAGIADQVFKTVDNFTDDDGKNTGKSR